MYCNKCGNEVDENQRYCNKCGNYLSYNMQNNTNNNRNNNTNIKNNLKMIIIIIIMIIIACGLVSVTIKIVKSLNTKENYHFEEETIGQGVHEEPEEKNDNKKGKYKTAIITDNVYSGISVNSIKDAEDLIVKDSVSQKQSDYSKEIMSIENNIIDKYGITAVNLKEMEKEYAEELEKVVSKIYNDYPNARGYLTNLTLTNLDMTQASVIAFFMPSFVFGMSDTSTTRPWVIKSQIQLNAKYFLNPERIDSSVEAASKAGHFPPNATRYSPLAHEFGHYLSFIALLNYYYTDSFVLIKDNGLDNYYDIMNDFGTGIFSKKMLDEAYQNYLKDNTYIEFDEWRGQISEYALAKDDTGSYIYDETIAEAFHDTYLNDKNAKKASKYIMEVLKKYVENK